MTVITALKCLFCGKPLKRNYQQEERLISEAEYFDLNAEAVSPSGSISWPRKGARLSGLRVRSLRRTGDGKRYATVSKPDGTFGHDDLFHSGRCGYLFGVVLARAGHRLKRVIP